MIVSLKILHLLNEHIYNFSNQNITYHQSCINRFICKIRDPQLKAELIQQKIEHGELSVPKVDAYDNTTVFEGWV